MLCMAKHILTTQRLRLREMGPGDLDFLARMMSDPEVMQFYPRVLDRLGAREWLDRMMARYAEDGYALWLVKLCSSGEPVGQAGLLKQQVDGVNEVEIVYLIHRPHWRQGFAAEAAIAVRDHAFQKLQIPRVISLIRPANIPSQRVALAYGAKPERHVQWRDLEHLVFSLRGE